MILRRTAPPKYNKITNNVQIFLWITTVVGHTFVYTSVESDIDFTADLGSTVRGLDEYDLYIVNPALLSPLCSANIWIDFKTNTSLNARI